MSTTRATLTDNGSTAFVKVKGPCTVSLYGAFLGGTAKVQRIDANGDTVDIAETSKTAAADLVLDFPPGDSNRIRVNLSGGSATSPLTEFIAEINDGDGG